MLWKHTPPKSRSGAAELAESEKGRWRACDMYEYGNRRPDQTDHSVVLRWSLDPRCVALARLELRKALAGWGLSELEDSAVLIVSELLTNAGLHAKVTPEQIIETRYFRSSGALRIEVHDGSPDRPQPRTPAPEAPDGRGLLLVDALADEWGVADRAGPGKMIWAALSLQGAAERNATGEGPGRG